MSEQYSAPYSVEVRQVQCNGAAAYVNCIEVWIFDSGI
jgi:hypothetical protein